MKKLQNNLTLAYSMLHSRKGNMAVILVAIALFVLSAAAPNATIGIGK